MGYGEAWEVEQVKSWMYRDSFKVVCELAKWEPGWVRDMILSIGDLQSSVRREITKTCLEIMKGVIRITDPDSRDVESMVMKNIVTVASERDQETAKHSGHTPTPSSLHTRSTNMHRNKQVENNEKAKKDAK